MATPVSFTERADGSICVLADAPQNSRRVGKTEVLYPPGLSFNAGAFDFELGDDTACLDMIPPSFDVFHEDVHHDVLGQAVGAEVLQQEAHMPEMKVGDASAFGGHGEAKILVELFRNLEVPGRYERLDFSDIEIRHCRSLRGLSAVLPAAVFPVEELPAFAA